MRKPSFIKLMMISIASIASFLGFAMYAGSMHDHIETIG